MDRGHYFSAEPAVVSSPRSVRLDLPDLSLTLETDRGVFAADAVDAGTRYLLLAGPPPPETGVIVDLGCGYGPIAVTLARRAPQATVYAVDVNERALALTARNAVAAGAANVVIGPPPDGVLVDALWSNPPIRIGKVALHALLAEWLDRLAPSRHAHLVVQRHLGADSLARWLAERGHPVRRVGSRVGYRLLDVGAR